MPADGVRSPAPSAPQTPSQPARSRTMKPAPRGGARGVLQPHPPYDDDVSIGLATLAATLAERVGPDMVLELMFQAAEHPAQAIHAAAQIARFLVGADRDVFAARYATWLADHLD